MLHLCNQMQPKSNRLRYVNSGPSQNQYIYISCHLGWNIQLNVSPLRLVIYRQQKRIILHIFCEIQGTAAGFYTMSSLVPVKANTITTPDIQAEIFR
jgi:uncharacterized integral membrane protein